jgi:hypothetical protein
MKDGLLCESLTLAIIAEASSSPAKALGIMVGMKRYWISPALLMPMIAGSVGKIADNSRSNSDLVHLSQSSTDWSRGGFDTMSDFGMIAANET